jgi:succinoglycan biosynthesis transport protein ExoP
VVDRARPLDKPVWPIAPLTLGVGFILGLVVGLLLALIVDHFDDRIKSANDIENFLGLSLLSVVPRFRSISVKAGKPSEASDDLVQREIAEAFSTLYSSLKLKAESKEAKCIMITSTIPGEGKSFISRNLALTFASHGEKTLLIDCDLRRPTVGTFFGFSDATGISELCAVESPLAAALKSQVRPNLDVLSAGKRSKHPAQDFTSHTFEALLRDLRTRYDRIIIDTPPVALVSDALLIMPHTDGAIYTLFFNKVHSKAALVNVRRLLEIHVPTFGVVLNGLNMNFAGYYYNQHYYRAYKDYYITPQADKDTS